MSSSDISIPVTALITKVGAQNKKTPYLILIEDFSGKSKVVKKFISLDIPVLLQSFVQTKGFFTEESEDTISSSFWDVIDTTCVSKKESVLEVFFPSCKIISMRSLIFKIK